MNLVITRMDNYFPVYIHVPKLESSGKKEIFMGYHKSSKDYRIYIPRPIQIEVRKDAIFEEEMTIQQGRGSDMEIDDDEEMRSYPPLEIKREYEERNKLIGPIDPVEPDDAPTDMAVSRKRPRWAQQTLQDANGHKAPHGIHRESKRPQRF